MSNKKPMFYQDLKYKLNNNLYELEDRLISLINKFQDKIVNLNSLKCKHFIDGEKQISLNNIQGVINKFMIVKNALIELKAKHFPKTNRCEDENKLGTEDEVLAILNSLK